MWKSNKEVAWHKAQLTAHTNELKKQITEAKDKKLEEIDNEINKIEEYYNNLIVWDEEKLSIKAEIDDYRKKYEEIKDYYSKLFKYDEWEEDENLQLSIKEEINNLKKSILAYKVKLLDWNEKEKSIKEQINELFRWINEYYTSIFWQDEIKDEETWEITQEWIKWYKNKLENLYNDNEKKYKELIKQIEDALPNATTAWLASAYSKNRKSFLIWNILWWLSFLISIIIIFIIFLLPIIDFNNIDTSKNIILEILKYINFKSATNYEELISQIFLRFPMLLPFIWLAYHSTKEQSKNKRLQQEYLHKESVMKTFTWYSNAINDLWDNDWKEIKKELLSIMIEMVANNPSDTLDKKHWTESPIHKLIDLDKIKSEINDINVYNKVKELIFNKK